MTQEEKLEEAKRLYETANADQKYVLESLFPELAELEDERIRKEITELVMQPTWKTEKEFHRRKELCAWLEKQGKQKETLCDKCKKAQPSHSCQDITALGRCALEKQGGQKPIIDIDKMVDDFAHTEVKGYGMPAMIEVDAYRKGVNDTTWLLLNLEKQDEQKTIDNLTPQEAMDIAVAKCFEQDEQKPADKVEPKFKVGDWISGYYTNYKVLSVNNNGYVVEDVDGNKINILFENEKFHNLWTIQDAKSGDVIVTHSGIVFIFKNIMEGGTISFHAALSTSNFASNTKIHIPEDNEQLGDQEVFPATKEQRDTLIKAMTDAGYTFDFDKKQLKKIEQNPTEDVDLPEFESYLCLMFQKFRTKGMCTNGEIIDYVKEHSQKLRDILVKPAWSEEDKNMLKWVTGYLDNKMLNTPIAEERTACKNAIAWLEKLKDKQKPNYCHHEVDLSGCSEEYCKAYYDGWNNCNQQHAQLEAEQKSDWSEEDKDFMYDTLSNLTELKDRYGEGYGNVGKCIDWLKSLKGRVQPRQEWSEEDDYNLQCCIAKVQFDIENGRIGRNSELLTWLKSLKERIKE